MSKRRRRPAPLWARIAAVAVVVIAVALVALLLSRLFAGILRLTRADGGETARDPQFAEPAEVVTRPPELMTEGEWPPMEEDPSEHWDLGEQTPVDKTAEELSREAEAGQP